MLEKAAAIKRFEYSPLGKDLKSKLVLQKNSIKNYTKFLDLIKRKKKIKTTQATSNLVYSKDFTFYKYHHTKEFAKRYFYSKRNDLIEFNDILELFYNDTE